MTLKKPTEPQKEPKTETKKPAKKVKRKLSKAAVSLVIGLLIIIIPLTIYAGILISASLQTGAPVEGDRFKGDLDPAITDEDVSKIIDKIKGMSGSKIDNVEIELISGQMRVYVDANDSLTGEELETLVDDVYYIVDSVTSVDKYFTSQSSRRMYDLAINVYNFVDAENEDMIYYILTKNAMMEEKTVQLVSEPLNEDLAAELRGELSEDVESEEETEEEIEE